MCADVLPNEARERNPERKERIVEEALDACVDGHARHRRIAEAVDVGLNDKRGDAHKDRLQARGNARTEDRHEVYGLKEGANDGEMPCAVEVEQFAQGKERRRILRDDSRRRSPRNAAGDDDEEQDIECDVEYDGGGEVVQGARCVTERAQDGACRIVEELREHTEQRDSQVEACYRDQLGGRCECRKQRFGQHDARRCKEYGKCKDGDEDALHEPAQACILFFPVEMGDEHAESRRKADEEVDNDGENEARRADGGKRLCPEHLPDEGGVRNAVELLQELREQDGQHEDEELTDDRPLCKVLLIGAVEEQDVQMMQIVMQKIIRERIAHAVDALLAFQGAELVEKIFHNEIFYHIAMQYGNKKAGESSLLLYMGNHP